jgi:hypothetical protein
MRRITFGIATAALTFLLGSSCVFLFGFVPELREFFEEPAPDVPPVVLKDDSYRCLEFYDEARTPENFDQFWSEFTSAVRQDDKEKLYALTEHGDFSWVTGGLKLSRRMCGDSPYYYYFIRDYDEFSRNYELIFNRTFKEAILTRTPEVSGPYAYSIYGEDGTGRRLKTFTLTFSNYKREGFKFVGLCTSAYYDD